MSNIIKLNRNKKISFLKGNHISRLPYGYIKSKDGNIIFDDNKIENVKKIFQLRIEGYGYYKIAKKLGLFDYNSRPRKILIKNILKNIFYVGYIKYNNKIVKGNHQGIINEDDFCKINDIKYIEDGM